MKRKLLILIGIALPALMWAGKSTPYSTIFYGDDEWTIIDANGDGKMLAAMATQIPVRNFMAMSMGVMSPKMLEGLLMILNDGESTFIGFNKILGGIPKALTKLPRLLKSI